MDKSPASKQRRQLLEGAALAGDLKQCRALWCRMHVESARERKGT